MEKKTIIWHGKRYYLLGADKYGERFYLMQGRFECEWYWSIGYIRSFTNNRNPERARDISSHFPNWSCFFESQASKGGYIDPNIFRTVFVETPLTDKEIWTLSELMQSLQIMRDYSDTIWRGGAHITSNPCKETIKDEKEYMRINETVIPALLEAVYDLLSPER